MPQNDSGLAFILPNNEPSTTEMIGTLKGEHDRKLAMRQQQQQQEEARQAALGKYVGDNFDPKDFSPLLQTQLLQKRQQLAQFIRDNPGAKQSDLDMLMLPQMQKLTTWNAKVKAVQDAAKEGIKTYDQYKGIDKAALHALALKDALYNPDGSLKDEKDIDPQVDYVKNAFEAHPDKTLINDFSAYDDLGKLDKLTVGDSYVKRDKKGAITKRKYSGQILPFQETFTDEDGEVKVRTKEGKPVAIYDSKQPWKQADDATLNFFVGHPERYLSLKKNFAQKAQEYGVKPEDAQWGTPIGDAIVKRMVYENLDKNVSKDRLVHADEDKAPVTRVTVNVPKPDEAKYSHPYEYLLGAVSGDPSIRSLGVPNEDGSVNVLPLMGGQLKIPSNGKFKEANYINVYPDGTVKMQRSWKERVRKYPNSKNNLETEEKEVTDDTPVEVKPQDLYKFINQTIEANSGKDPYKNRQFIHRYFDEKGRPKFSLPQAAPPQPKPQPAPFWKPAWAQQQ